MKRNNFIYTSSIRLLSLLIAVAGFSFAAQQKGFAADFDMLFSNDIRGEIEPCG